MMMTVLGRFVYRSKCMSPHYARSGSSSAIEYARQRVMMRNVYPGGFHFYDTLQSKYRNIGSSELIIPLFSRCAFSTRRSDPDMSQCNTIDDLIETAYDHLDTISPRGIAEFWSSLVKHVQNHRGGNSRAQLNEKLAEILCNTLENMYNFDGREIATIAISLAKLMKQVEFRGQRAATGSLHRILHNLLIGEVNSENKHYIFSEIAVYAVPILSKFEARHLSNLIYSFGHAEYVPKDESGRTIFDVLALEAMSKLNHFKPQGLSNMLWSYAKMESSNSLLFAAVGDSIMGMNDLSEFWPQHFSNIVWSYATVGESHPKLFSKFGDHIASLDDLGQFMPQALSNIIWAYATAGEAHPKLYRKFADRIVAMTDLQQLKPQALSNIIWSYATAGESHPQLYRKFGNHIVAMKDLGQFKPQELSNIIWAYATAGESPPQLFSKFGNHIVAMKDLGQFKPQNLSNILWSYATAGEAHPKLFKKIADHIVAMNDLSQFKPQALSNIIWSYATAGESHPKLFSKFGDHIVAMKDLGLFKPQALSNIVWSFSTAGESHPQLFSKVSDHIVAMKDVGQFLPQALPNIIWAFATAGESHPQLYSKFGDYIVAMKDLSAFLPQALSNIIWSYATVGIIDPHLFTSFAPAVKSVLIQCSSQALANIAWAYAVANVNDHLLFNTDFIDVCQAKANDFIPLDLRQLHQWQLWQDELKSGINLPQALREKCHQAFVSESYQSSRLQDDVVSVLSSIGMSPKEEVLTASGYRLDALVEVNGMKVGIEVDGPYHFINQEPTGSTFLKRRQVTNLDDIRIVSVPYWDWDKLGKDRVKKQQYLRSKLGLV